MRRSVVIVPGGTGGTGGLSIDVRNLANGLAARGHDVFIASVDAADPALVALAGVTVVPLQRRGPASLGATFGLYTGIRGVLRERPGAVVHVFGSMPSYLTFAALAAARLGRHPLVWTPMFHPLRARVWRRRLLLSPMLLFDWLIPRTGRFVDAVGAATDAEAAAFEKYAKRLEVLPPVVEPSSLCPESEAIALREAAGVGKSPLIVVVASRAEPRKGLDFAWAAFERLQLSNPAVRLVLVGAADMASALPAGASALGRVDDATLTCALRAADVVFVPSLFEAFSRVVIEAWQQETPVVVSDGVALAPVVQHIGGTPVAYGDVAAAAEELGRLLSDRNGAAAEGIAGELLVRERFLLDRLIDRIEELYRWLSDGNARGASPDRLARAA